MGLRISPLTNALSRSDESGFQVWRGQVFPLRYTFSLLPSLSKAFPRFLISSYHPAESIDSSVGSTKVHFLFATASTDWFGMSWHFSLSDFIGLNIPHWQYVLASEPGSAMDGLDIFNCHLWSLGDWSSSRNWLGECRRAGYSGENGHCVRASNSYLKNVCFWI